MEEILRTREEAVAAYKAVGGGLSGQDLMKEVLSHAIGGRLFYGAILNVCRRYSLISGWTPPSGTKILLYHSEQDDTVPFDNLTSMKTFLDSVAPGCYTASSGNNGGHVLQ